MTAEDVYKEEALRFAADYGALRTALSVFLMQWNLAADYVSVSAVGYDAGAGFHGRILNARIRWLELTDHFMNDKPYPEYETSLVKECLRSFALEYLDGCPFRAESQFGGLSVKFQLPWSTPLVLPD